jgi:predicted transcriptional regulator
LPALANPKHERFAQELSKGRTGDEAYVLAGYKRNKDNASRLKAHESISARVAEIIDRGAIRAEVTLQSLIDEAVKIGNAAFAAGQFAPAISALKEKGVLTGLRIERSERKNINDPAEMDDGELADIARTGRDGVAEAQARKAVLN